jgi:phenylpropionate dioxygenase-like ring-hydroxylating dioxygenase large terminal subunit
MLKNFWYACDFSHDVTKQPKQVVMLKHRFALYRNAQGDVVALKDQCPHRGAALSGGWLEDDCLRCPYHGWKFDPNGQCVNVPANPSEVAIPKKAQVETYPVQEQYGFVWIFLGDLPESERPPIPPLPEFEDPKLYHLFLDFQVNTHYTRVLENSIDMSHLPIVHGESFGAGFKDDPTIPHYEVEDEGWGVSATIHQTSTAKSKGLFGLFAREETAELTSKLTFYLPNITKVESSSSKIKIVNYAIHFPVDENTTISKRILFRSFFRYSWLDKPFKKYYSKIYAEDSRVSETQYPTVVPVGLADEVHVASDALQIAYRKLHQKYVAMGWTFDGKPSSLKSFNRSNGHLIPN